MLVGRAATGAFAAIWYGSTNIPRSQRLEGLELMADLVFVVVTVCAFALMAAYVKGCEKVR